MHRGLHYLANAATEAYEGAREQGRGVPQRRPSHEEIIFTRNATEAINLVALSFGGPHIGPGDEIVLSIMEHHSNIVPWHFLRERHGAVIKWAPVDDEGDFLIDEFEKLLTPRTKMVAITQMSNVLGTMVPVKEVMRDRACARHSGAGRWRQGAVHLDVDVQDIDCDFYVFTGHKLYGPTGIGALYAKHEHLDAMPPFNGGGEMIREVTEDRVTYGDPPLPIRSRHAGDRAGHRARRPRSTTSTRSARRASAPMKHDLRELRRRSGCGESIRCASSAAPRTRGRSSRLR